MQFWTGQLILDLVWIAVMLSIASILLRALPPLRSLGIPTAMLAGFIGLGLGPSGLGVLPFDVSNLEILVYHGLALVFIAVSLQAPPEDATTAEARSYAFAIASMNVLQAVIGLVFVLVWTAFVLQLHPGFGLMLPLGFQQGPGQALSLGTAWEATGMPDGGSIGLIVATLGYTHCVLIGVPIVLWARRNGWVSKSVEGPAVPVDIDREEEKVSEVGPGALEHLTSQLVAIGVVYAAVFLFLGWLTPMVSKADAAMLWGFHFIIGAIFAMAFRGGLSRLPITSPLDNGLLGRASAVVVDVTTCAAIAAVRVEVLGAWLAPIVIMTTIGGGITAVICIWLAKRAFPEDPFENALVLFGSSTGTVPTGLALLRIVDPHLRSSATRNTVLGGSFALILAAPLLLIVIKMPIAGWPESYPGAVWQTLGVLAVYQALVLIGWRFFAPLQLRGKGLKIWPD